MSGHQSMFLGLGIGLGVAFLAVVADRSAAEDKETRSDAMLYELRTYTAAEGKVSELHARFRDHTMKLFEKHGMKNIVYLIPVDKPNTLVYVIAHKNKAAAEKSWQAFRDDPEWQSVYKESQKNGTLVDKVESVYLTPTDYSPMK